MLVSKNFSDIVTFTRASARWRFSSGGVLVQDGPSVPSLDYDPVSLAARGLLVEEQRTNLLTYSNDLTNAGWSKAAVSVTDAGSGKVPGFNAQMVVPDATNAAHYVTRNPTLTASTDYCIWAIVKAAGYMRCTIYATATASFGASFDLTAKTSADYNLAGGGVVKGRGVIDLGGGYLLIWVGGQAPWAAAPNVVFRLRDNSGADTFAGDGTSGIVFSGSQVEAGICPTSLVPTTSAQATRTADSAAITDLSKIAFNAGEGTLYADVITPQVSSTANGMVALHDGTISNRMVAYFTSGAVRVLASIGGASQSFLVGAAPAPGAVCKLAFAYRPGDFAASMNGAAAVPWALSGVPPVSALRLGGTNAGAGSEALNSWLRNLRYFPRRFSNAELQALTT
ncbi:phage head spike fiber domain-containing protein [Cupriavidus basilensis]